VAKLGSVDLVDVAGQGVSGPTRLNTPDPGGVVVGGPQDEVVIGAELHAHNSLLAAPDGVTHSTGVGLKDLNFAVRATGGKKLAVVGGGNAVYLALVGHDLLLRLGGQQRCNPLHTVKEIRFRVCHLHFHGFRHQGVPLCHTRKTRRRGEKR